MVRPASVGVNTNINAVRIGFVFICLIREPGPNRPIRQSIELALPACGMLLTRAERSRLESSHISTYTRRDMYAISLPSYS
jgi:hypothetical protein